MKRKHDKQADESQYLEVKMNTKFIVD